jgi:branched-chain amino acid transport system permease protein
MTAGAVKTAAGEGLRHLRDQLGPRGRTVLVVAASLLFPLVAPSEYWIRVAGMIGLYSMLALGLNIVVGFAGLLDLGYVAFYGIGSYLYAILASPHFNIHLPFWLLLVLCVLATAISGVVIGAPTLRVKGDYLAIVTLGFGEIAYILFINLDRPINITNGVNGLLGVDPPTILGFTVGTPFEVAGIDVTRTTQFYYLILFFTLAITFFVYQIRNSHIGRAWAAIREDEVAALAMGIHTTRLKLLAFAIGASTAGVAGAVSASWSSSVFPDSFLFMESINILCMVILGGIGSIPGAIVGSALLVGIPEVLRDLRIYRLTAFSLILILMMIFRPQGILGSEQRRKELLAEREEEPEPAGAAPAPAAKE